jgi:cobalt-zinc-cadmium efflux system protein
VSAGHGHQHPDRGDSVQRLRIALALMLAFLVVELVVAVLVHSLALLADAGHMLTDVAALATALWAIHLAARPTTGTWSFGLKRAEILSAAVNGVTLVAVAGIVTVEAVRRLQHPRSVGGGGVLAVALVGVVVSVVASWVLARGHRTSLNVEGAFQHILTDAAGFTATAVAGLLIMTNGYRRADAIASLLVVVLMVRAAWSLLKASGRVLLEGTPEGVDLDDVRHRLLAADPHVVDVHDLHAWVLTSDHPAMSAHVVLDDSCFSDGHAPRVLDALQEAMRADFDMDHSTLQLEMAQHATHEVGTH